jgi:hypothetical protein
VHSLPGQKPERANITSWYSWIHCTPAWQLIPPHLA